MYGLDGPEDAEVPISEDGECWHVGEAEQSVCAPIFLNSRFLRDVIWSSPRPPKPMAEPEVLLQPLRDPLPDEVPPQRCPSRQPLPTTCPPWPPPRNPPRLPAAPTPLAPRIGTRRRRLGWRAPTSNQAYGSINFDAPVPGGAGNLPAALGVALVQIIYGLCWVTIALITLHQLPRP